MDFFIAILASAVRSGTPILFATLGEVVAERAGVMNLGLEGVMLVGAYAGFAATKATGNPWIGIAAAFTAGVAVTLIHAFLSITLMLNWDTLEDWWEVGLGLSIPTNNFAGKLVIVYDKDDEWTFGYSIGIPVWWTGPLP